MSLDPSSLEHVTTRIVAVRTATRECWRLQLDETELLVTSDHPLYCPETNTWAPAGDWAVGKRRTLLWTGDEAPPRAVDVRASGYGGVHEVFDLTVEHALHNFVANGVLVHNKSQVLPDCLAPDGGQVFNGAACECPDGSAGYVQCTEALAPMECGQCEDAPPDGGANDGG